jgi:hypothetical protein
MVKKESGFVTKSPNDTLAQFQNQSPQQSMSKLAHIKILEQSLIE